MKWLIQLSIIVVTLSTYGCAMNATTQQYQCVRDDHSTSRLLGGDVSGHVEFWNVIEQDWIYDSIRCEVGDYVFIVPADKNRHHYILFRGDMPEVIRLGDGHVAIMDGKSIDMAMGDRDNDGHPDTVSYAVYQGNRIVNAIDYNLDTQPDVRISRNADGETRMEAWIDDRWQGIIINKGYRLADSPDTKLRQLDDGTFSIVEPD